MRARADGRKIDPILATALGLVVLTLLYLLGGTLPAVQDLERMRIENGATSLELREERGRREALEDRLEGLKGDPQSVERELRRTLNLVRPGERVIVPYE